MVLRARFRTVLQPSIEWITGDGVAILADDRYVTYGIIAAGLWPQIAYVMILYLTGLNNVRPRSGGGRTAGRCKGLADAVVCDPAATAPCHLHRRRGHVIGALRSFDLVSIMTDGGPYGSSRVLSLLHV